ncbi:AlkA N-terminal domain-containing protein [Sinomonas sp. ASV486]|uniref:DNA-3-methyladenine glycosylase family protein n=1 Tax=Sinomonas sp. ASV486 TaxID=3051170 RepID=UPI0027DDE34F|nr:AlkA N-terminal domain-containing protein [Sinomonas sp. ASV486]MDQ4489905.1 AlkA N-terminal domain-containing protein [Sinomonas sp. ASV486]
MHLEANGGLEPAAMLASLAAHSIPGAERTQAGAGIHERLVCTTQGPVAASVRLRASGVDVTLEGPREAEGEALAAVRTWLDLDADLDDVRAALVGDPDLRPLVLARPGLRVIGTTNVFQTVVTTVLGQQVSLAAGRTFAGRLVASYGTPGPGGLLLFPRPAHLAGTDPGELRAAVGLTAARARTVHAVALAFADRRGAENTTENDAATPHLTRDELLALPGIGPWTVDYLEVRTGNPDAFAPGDLVLRRALGGISAAQAAARSEVWRPFRAYALVHLWTAAAYL